MTNKWIGTDILYCSHCSKLTSYFTFIMFVSRLSSFLPFSLSFFLPPHNVLCLLLQGVPGKVQFLSMIFHSIPYHTMGGSVSQCIRGNRGIFLILSFLVFFDLFSAFSVVLPRRSPSIGSPPKGGKGREGKGKQTLQDLGRRRKTIDKGNKKSNTLFMLKQVAS